jgi:hypothetical protein
MEYLLLILIILLGSQRSFRAGVWQGLTSRRRRLHKHDTYRNDTNSRKVVTHKSKKGTVKTGFSVGNQWQKRNARYAKKDVKREGRQMRTGNK